MATSVLSKVYETLLCSPGMNEAVKIDVKIDRKTVLLLSSVIDGALAKEGGNAQELLKLVPTEDAEALKNFGEECLKKAGLSERTKR
jgi:hypothetical protein